MTVCVAACLLNGRRAGELGPVIVDRRRPDDNDWEPGNMNQPKQRCRHSQPKPSACLTGDIDAAYARSFPGPLSASIRMHSQEAGICYG